MHDLLFKWPMCSLHFPLRLRVIGTTFNYFYLKLFTQYWITRGALCSLQIWCSSRATWELCFVYSGTSQWYRLNTSIIDRTYLHVFPLYLVRNFGMSTKSIWWRIWTVQAQTGRSLFKTNVEPLVNRWFRKYFLDVSFCNAAIAAFKLVVDFSHSWSFRRLTHLIHDIMQALFLNDALSTITEYSSSKKRLYF